MKKHLSLVFCLMCFLTGCSSKYVSNYKATMMTTSNTTNNCSMSFNSFEGTYVFKVKKTNSSEGEGNIQYTASLETGTIDVYYHVEIYDS